MRGAISTNTRSLGDFFRFRGGTGADKSHTRSFNYHPRGWTATWKVGGGRVTLSLSLYRIITAKVAKRRVDIAGHIVVIYTCLCRTVVGCRDEKIEVQPLDTEPAFFDLVCE